MLRQTNNKNGKHTKKMMAYKRTGKKEEKKNFGQTNSIIIQKKNPTVSEKIKKYELLEVRETADLFYKFSSLTLRNVKQVCKDHYNHEIGSCAAIGAFI